MAQWTMQDGEFPSLSGVPVLTQLLTAPEPYLVCRMTAQGPVCTALPESPILGCLAHAGKLSVLKFRGTVQQWERVQKSDFWRKNAGFDRVICTDGTVLLQ